VRASAHSYARAWRTHFGLAHDPSAVLGEQNLFRYRPCRRVLVRGAGGAPGDAAALCQVLLAACATGVPLTVSVPLHSRGSGWLGEVPGVDAVAEGEDALAERLALPGDIERLRAWAPLASAVRAAAHRGGVTPIDAPVLAHGRLELRWYLREQTISLVRHRYGSLLPPLLVSPEASAPAS
jgi:RHH-type proline utilization regulon transcriptional repressor/proline dehydrogenase/delta 1-pyrroline-5-carboxylate dehydrogenase